MELYRICWKHTNGTRGHGEYIFTYESGMKCVENITNRRRYYGRHHLRFDSQEESNNYTYWIEPQNNEYTRSINRCSLIKEELVHHLWIHTLS